MSGMSTVASVHQDDPAKEILDKIGDLSQIDVLHNQILVAVYIRSNEIKFKSGVKLYTSLDKPREDKFQGKVGLVLKMGPLAYKDDENTKFHGQTLNIGDWVAFRPSDGWAIEINGVHCRLFIESGIPMRIPRPDVVY